MWLTLCTLTQLALSGGLFTAALFLSRTQQTSNFAIPPSAKAQRTSSRVVIGGPLALHREPPRLRLPDLRTELTFLGINGRPDAEKICVHVSTKDGAVRTLPVDTQCPLIYRDGSYQFAQEFTGLWIEPVAATTQQLTLAVGMVRSDGGTVSGPSEMARFHLQVQSRNEKWQIGAMRVDSSLLARLRARWFGEDLFFTHHGGSEFAHAAGKQRIDFGEGDESYSCYVQEGSALVWRQGRWWEASGTTYGEPLMVIKRVETKSMQLEVWDGEGRNRTNLTLMRARDAWLPTLGQNMVRFCAAKTRSLFLLEVGDERLAVSPGDWLLLDKNGWRKLASLDEIDSYVDGQLVGELLIIDGLKRSEGKQVLEGHIYNKTRSAVKNCDLPLRAEGEPT